MEKAENNKKFGREIPVDTSLSYQIDEGMVVPVVWSLGPAFCGHCENFKSRSFQSLAKHMQTRHPGETRKHERDVQRETLNFPRGKDGLTGGFEMRYNDPPSGGEGTNQASGGDDENSTGSKNSEKTENYKKFGRKIPVDTCVSYQIDEGMVVPVVWSLGPAFCGHCANVKSRSFQSLAKHMQTRHPGEIKKHERDVQRETLNFPRGKDGLTGGFEMRYNDPPSEGKDTNQASGGDDDETDDENSTGSRNNGNKRHAESTRTTDQQEDAGETKKRRFQLPTQKKKDTIL